MIQSSTVAMSSPQKLCIIHQVGMTAATAEQRRARCARAAQQRATCPVVNLAGLPGGEEVVRRRAKCLEAR